MLSKQNFTIPGEGPKYCEIPQSAVYSSSGWILDFVPMNRTKKYGKIFNSLGVGFLGKIIWIESILVYSYSEYRPDTSDL